MDNILRHSTESENKIAKPRETWKVEECQVEEYEVSDLVTMASENQFGYFAEETREEKCRVFGVNFEDIIDNTSEPYYTESILAHLIQEKALKDRWQDFTPALVSSRPGKHLMFYWKASLSDLEAVAK